MITTEEGLSKLSEKVASQFTRGHRGYVGDPLDVRLGGFEEDGLMMDLDAQLSALVFAPVRALVDEGHLLSDDPADTALDIFVDAHLVTINLDTAALDRLGPRRRRLVLTALRRQLARLAERAGPLDG